jgi:hypothetical protein
MTEDGLDEKTLKEILAEMVSEIEQIQVSIKQQQEMMNKFTEQVTNMPVAAAKQSTKQWRILLFPETNQEQYYKLVFGRLIPWSFAFLASIILFRMGQSSLDAYQARQYNIEATQCIKAWNDVYQHQSPKVQASMGKAWKNAGNQK